MSLVPIHEGKVPLLRSHFRILLARSAHHLGIKATRLRLR